MSYLVQMLIRASGLDFKTVQNFWTPEVSVSSQSNNNRAKKSIERYICAYMGPGESNCQGWQMPLHALPTQIVFTRVILVIIFLFRDSRTVNFRLQTTYEGISVRLINGPFGEPWFIYGFLVIHAGMLSNRRMPKKYSNRHWHCKYMYVLNQNF